MAAGKKIMIIREEFGHRSKANAILNAVLLMCLNKSKKKVNKLAENLSEYVITCKSFLYSVFKNKTEPLTHQLCFSALNFLGILLKVIFQ